MSYKKVPKISRDKNGNYPMTEKQKIEAAAKVGPKYMIATKADHLMGDLSRDFQELSTENLCLVDREMDGFYLGSWVTGFGFFDVKFPKETTRELTKEEVEQFNKQYIQLASFPARKLKVD